MAKFEENPHPDISLIDLSKQFEFDVNDEIIEKICFAETLIISCAHDDGVLGGDESDSDWTCADESSTTEIPEAPYEAKKVGPLFIEDPVEEEEALVPVKREDSEPNFHFFFYPKCDTSQPDLAVTSFVVGKDGIPVPNEDAEPEKPCSCDLDMMKNCKCTVPYPCTCSNKTTFQCECKKVKDVCTCVEGYPSPTCECKGDKICVCHPHKKYPMPNCTCVGVEKPCVCITGKFPSPVCTCTEKPLHIEPSVCICEDEPVPCQCQKTEPKPDCTCQKGDDCTCEYCLCGLVKACLCKPKPKLEKWKDAEEKLEGEGSDLPKSSESSSLATDIKSVCSCDKDSFCICEEPEDECKCYKPVDLATSCICEGPPKEECKCHLVCDCPGVCTCETQVPAKKKKEECICLDVAKQLKEGRVCICPKKKKKSSKLKRMRTKDGYRWCHDVDPRHTFFDYGYGMHDKISYEPERQERVRILGYGEDGEDGSTATGTQICPVHGTRVKVPEYKKKVRAPSLDCCSAVGGMSISIETLGEEKDKLLVQVVSNSSKEGSKTGTKLVSIIDLNFHTMEENRTEHITKRDITKERRSYMAICDNGYYNKVTMICGDHTVVKRLYHSFEAAHNFLLEGANIALLRYFALRRFRGTIKTDTVLMGGEICESIYVSLGISQSVVNNKPLFVLKVQRHIIQPGGNVHQTLSVVSLRGYIISNEWADNNYVIHINPLLEVIPERDIIEEHAPLRERWREDLQLFSDYLDMKAQRTSEGARYVSENGALAGTIREYLQTILLLKPSDTLHFTRHYFQTVLSSLDLPHDEYFDPCSRHVRYFFFED